MIRRPGAPGVERPAWLVASIVAQILLLAYLQVIEWVNLYPWNDVRHGNGQEALDIFLGVIMAVCILFTWRRWGAGMWFATGLYMVWMGLQVWTFWIPYVLGASPRWERIHAAHFSETIQWLPSYGNHLPPDACHFVLQLILLATLTLTGAAALKGGVGGSASPSG